MLQRVVPLLFPHAVSLAALARLCVVFIIHLARVSGRCDSHLAALAAYKNKKRSACKLCFFGQPATFRVNRKPYTLPAEALSRPRLPLCQRRGKILGEYKLVSR